LGKQDQIWAKFFCIPKNMHSRTPVALPIIHYSSSCHLLWSILSGWMSENLISDWMFFK